MEVTHLVANSFNMRLCGSFQVRDLFWHDNVSMVNLEPTMTETEIVSGAEVINSPVFRMH